MVIVNIQAKSVILIKFVPLIQLVEYLTFNQEVRSSNLRWHTKESSWVVKGVVCKTIAFRFDGSNPSSPTNYI